MSFTNQMLEELKRSTHVATSFTDHELDGIFERLRVENMYSFSTFFPNFFFIE